jgi:hypothetical protein
MMKSSFLLVSLLITLNIHAQGIYRWQDANGKTVYGDNPPSNHSSIDALDAPAVEEPYRPKEVILYVTSNCGEICDAAVYFLQGYRVEYQSYSIDSPADLAEFKRRGGKQELPALQIGNDIVLHGFDASKWTRTLKDNGLRKIIYRPAKPLSER